MQTEQNPDVNSRNPDPNAGESETPTAEPGRSDIESPPDTDTIPVPPDVKPTAPVEEPPGTGGPPIGDVDNSPKQIVDERSGHDPRV